ncbi:hypothetical protein M2459_000304 [Parabacteroides sp. PF5-5]|nr:hypothetical protein [Parabacteroides sp. PH5-39]MDH6314589.1 hypothetical protein [Parabacteroides sp. PF5-13]MDH6318346.1 hypothetical protein [Parabacteroides sp. PH5-13]MDH6322362.1 hypothetical protein [Parabacteroides sp. PH5-8]MDH6325559.1 hypothetical protein [Parabacteroides sp. PH5-41]MDH6333578.1 hypothetical protein [Parabacteroides sp. PF5-5]MDH6344424.1 hypothetical protein [Parabacteroides sp. PH5-46]MDH6359599.1 hypothetical protein [Parabacteroides sp. PH5-16]MDH6375264.
MTDFPSFKNNLQLKTYFYKYFVKNTPKFKITESYEMRKIMLIEPVEFPISPING